MPEIEVDWKILLLALQKGLTAEKALLTPPFQSDLKKKSTLEELSAVLQHEKGERNKHRVESKEALEKVECNAELVIGGEGAWNLKFHEELMNEFGAKNERGYNLAKTTEID